MIFQCYKINNKVAEKPPYKIELRIVVHILYVSAVLPELITYVYVQIMLFIAKYV